ncbi:MAG: hypothetical protein J6V04_00575 [Bacteroidales bacterium]|nr:hypothetical protein [Bacteroidales bacterium]MBO7322478.1 hypothetical protein [Bacteroidales bacterium]
MKRTNLMTLAAFVILMLITNTNTAFGQLNKFYQKAKENAHRIENAIEKDKDKKEAEEAKKKEAAYQADVSSGKTYYVNAATGSNRNDGSAPDKAIKDLQKAINVADEGSVILVAEGNYLGTLDQGFIELKKYMSLIGGFNSDFSERNPVQYITWIRPDASHLATSGAHASLDIYVTGKRDGVVLIDGFSFDKGQYNKYCKHNPSDPITGSPEGCETGRILSVDEAPTVATVGGAPISIPLLRGNVQGQVTIRNCTFINANDFAVSMGCKGGHFNIYNNVFVANRMAACEVRGMMADHSLCSVDFHHNTVLFTWCRTKVMDGQGVAFRYHTGITTRVYNNILGCSNHAALERVYVDANPKVEAARITTATDNIFFMNFNQSGYYMGNADLMLPSGGGKWLFVSAAQFEDVEQLVEYEGNMEMPAEMVEKFSQAIDPAYLKGYLGLNMTQYQNYDRNSAANQLNRLFGQNQQGTEIIRVSMYGNRYPYMKAFDLFGVIDGYGAQMPQ